MKGSEYLEKGWRIGVGIVLLNKQDSSYLMFGEIYLYIQEKDFTTANDIIRKNERNI